MVNKFPSRSRTAGRPFIDPGAHTRSAAQQPAQASARIRPDAQPLVDFFNSTGVSINQFPAGPDGWHSAASIRAALSEWARRAMAARSAASAQAPAVPATPPPAPTPAPQAVTRPATAAGPYASTAGLPAFTASGLDPKVLASYPPAVRSVMAAVSTQAEAYAIGQKYGGMTNDEAMTAMVYDVHIPAEIAFAGRPEGYVEASGTPRATADRGQSHTSLIADGGVALQQQYARHEEQRRRAESPELYAFWDSVGRRNAAAPNSTGSRTSRPASDVVDSHTTPSSDYWF